MTLFSAIIEFDEQNEALKIAGFMALYWTDEYLTWTPGSHNGVTEIFVVRFLNFLPNP